MAPLHGGYLHCSKPFGMYLEPLLPDHFRSYSDLSGAVAVSITFQHESRGFAQEVFPDKPFLQERFQKTPFLQDSIPKKPLSKQAVFPPKPNAPHT